ncbi:MAG: cytochrome c3 family protein [Coriobacteriia bacterium]
MFPHESDNVGLLLEEEDSLCTNCHTMSAPPP